MFEKIILGILNSTIGQYIDGLDAKNLEFGIFSGQITIENVKLKANLTQMLELPFDLTFSHINKLIMKIPLYNISKSPVEIELEGFYVVLKAQKKSDWSFKDYSSFKTKLE